VGLFLVEKRGGKHEEFDRALIANFIE